MGFVPDPVEFMKDQGFIEDLARFADGILTEKQVRQKYHLFGEDIWTDLGKDDALVERIELEKTRRIRSGATKRELAQLHVTKGPAILDGIMSDPKQSARHRVDAIKTLNDLADPGPQHFAQDQDRIIIRIDLSADTKDPADVLTFDAAIRPNPNPNDTKVIEHNSAPKGVRGFCLNDDPPLDPPKRGPGRPPGSRNKTKAPELLPIIAANKQTDGGSSGQPL